MKYLLLCVLLTVSCARAMPDSGEDADEALHPCTDPLTDFWNCGACGYACSPADADACFDGGCTCGDEAACTGDKDCRGGKCVSPNPAGRICEFDDTCIILVNSGQRCIGGHCTKVECAEETCNGQDDDCDGDVDETDTGAPLSEYCFSGTPEQLNPPCRPGARVCLSEGTWSDCFGEYPPTAEQGFLACDLLDNDCDNCIDGVIKDGECVQQPPTLFQVAIYLDGSGSMSGSIQGVIAAVDGFAGSIPNPAAFEWALVKYPAEWSTTWELVTDFTDLVTFQQTLALLNMRTSGGSEPNWDVIYESGTEELPLSWRPGSVRILINFTDEEGQSYRNPLINEADMCASLVHGEVLGSFTSPVNQADFDDCGTWFDISNPLTLQVDMRSLLDDPCGG